ncbi:MAG: hypothetical protein R2694_17370 [Ilumatobacteraceae bacterium]
MTAWLVFRRAPRLEMAMATFGRASTAATRLRRRVQVIQKRPSFQTKFMITPTGSWSFVVHMNVHSVWALSSSSSRSSDSTNMLTSS